MRVWKALREAHKPGRGKREKVEVEVTDRPGKRGEERGQIRD